MLNLLHNFVPNYCSEAELQFRLIFFSLNAPPSKNLAPNWHRSYYKTELLTILQNIQNLHNLWTSLFFYRWTRLLSPSQLRWAQ